MKALSKKQRWIAIGLFAVVATLAAFTLMSGPFGYFSVCDRCGALRRTTNWQIPSTSLTFFTHSTETESALSQVLLTNGIVQPHEHHWLFGHGGGNGVKCAIGTGRHIRPAVDSQEFAGLVLLLHTAGETDFRDRVLRGVFDPDTSHFFRSLSFSAPKPPTGSTELRNWIADESQYLDEFVDPYKER